MEPLVSSTKFKKKHKLSDFDDFDDDNEQDNLDPKPMSKKQSLNSVKEDIKIDISDNTINNIFNITDSAITQGKQLQSQIDNMSDSSNIPSSVNSAVPEQDAHNAKDTE